jgi:hypothetical protein
VDSNSDSGQPDLRQIVREIQELQQRVRALEEQVGGHLVPRPSAEVSPGLTTTPATSSHEDTAKAIPVFGKAVLAIAGAYFLRALTEFKAISLTAGLFAGTLYALAWLLLAAHAAAKKPFVGAVRGLTSALILAPLLWEATVRFHALSTWTAAGVLVVFSSFGFAVSWRHNLSIIAWTTTVAGLLTTFALLLATHDLVPFTLALLVIAAVVECSACFDHWLRERWIVALVADLAVLLLAYIAAPVSGVPEGYAPIPAAMALAAQIALPVIYLSSTSVRALWCGCILTPFETTQMGLALLLSMSGVLRIAHGDPAAIKAVAGFALVCGAVFYVFSFGFSGRAGMRGRTFYTYSTLGLLLVFAGSRMQFSGTTLALILSALALVGLCIDRWKGSVTLRWHAAVYLLLSAVLSGLTAWAAARNLGSRHGWIPLATAAWISAAATLLGYALVWRRSRAWRSSPDHGLPVLAIAASGAWTLAGVAAGALTALCVDTSVAPFCTTLRTFVLTVLAMLLAWTGTTWKRLELVWLVYPLMIVTAYKLLAQDLPDGQTSSLFVSLFLYGGALVLLPRILQRSR